MTTLKGGITKLKCYFSHLLTNRTTRIAFIEDFFRTRNFSRNHFCPPTMHCPQETERALSSLWHVRRSSHLGAARGGISKVCIATRRGTYILFVPSHCTMRLSPLQSVNRTIYQNVYLAPRFFFSSIFQMTNIWRKYLITFTFIVYLTTWVMNNHSHNKIQ